MTKYRQPQKLRELRGRRGKLLAGWRILYGSADLKPILDVPRQQVVYVFSMMDKEVIGHLSLGQHRYRTLETTGCREE